MHRNKLASASSKWRRSRTPTQPIDPDEATTTTDPEKRTNSVPTSKSPVASESAPRLAGGELGQLLTCRAGETAETTLGSDPACHNDETFQERQERLVCLRELGTD